MKLATLFIVAVLASVVLVRAGTYTIGGFTFDEANAVQTAVIVEGPPFLTDHSAPRFARFSPNYAGDPLTQTNEFYKFDRTRSLGHLLGRRAGGSIARHVTFPEPGELSAKDLTALPNVHRCAIELTWGGSKGVPNKPGPDFVVFESGEWEGFAVSARKAWSNEFAPYRYQFPDSKDEVNNVNAVAVDLSKFGFAEGEVITAVRIRNIFNTIARAGADKVDDASGQGRVVYSGDPIYKNAFPLKKKADGTEFKVNELGADLVYVAALHDLVPLPPKPAPVEQPAPSADATPAPSGAQSNSAAKP